MASTIQTDKIGKLGFGYMRLPRIKGEFDYEQINKMADMFLENGGTYFDTAYGYEGAEVALRESVVKRHPRDSFQIATKLPMWSVTQEMTIEKLHKTSMDRLGTDYIDFYLLHSLNSNSNKMAESVGAWDYLAKLKAQGTIRHMGFSFHGSPEELDEILTKHPEAEFTQLQINYWDWDSSKAQARRLYEVARKHDVQIIVMEPLLGGKLASTDSPIAELFHGADPNSSIASWALRFVAQLDGVFTTLSGMSNLEQMADNIKTYSDIKQLSKDELVVIEKAVAVLKGVPRVDCTSCDYCKDCPANIKISSLINLYNDHLVHNTTTNLGGTYNWLTSDSGKACDCTKCERCEDICPQDIEILDILAKVSKLFD